MVNGMPLACSTFSAANLYASCGTVAAPWSAFSADTNTKRGTPALRAATIMCWFAEPSIWRIGFDRLSGLPCAVVITVGWGAVNRIDLEPAHCGDPQCDADHGYTGTSSNDDFTVRISEADGEDSVLQALAFAATLSAVSSH